MLERPPTESTAEFEQVVLVSGHMVDAPDRRPPRFPASAEPAVTGIIAATFARWDVGRGTLVISGGARGVDIIAAEQAAERNADVWLLIALPEADFIASSVDVPGTPWSDRFGRLRRRCPTWFQPTEAGGDPFERNNDWCLEVAAAQARLSRLRILAVWDGEPGDGTGGTEHLVARAREAGAAVEVIPPPVTTAD